ncbi:MAG TPA: transposase [Candidatus Paceibacterota bacterium]
MRKESFAIGEYYHIYNRGVDKRKIVQDKFDSSRFIESLIEFNTVKPIGSIFEKNRSKNKLSKIKIHKPLINIVAYCLNPNHFHMILEQIEDSGISKFMKRLAGGYSWYFNNRYKRSGTLFQGPFKAKHIDSNEYLLHVSTYVNLNNKVHRVGDLVANKLVKSSWNEYLSPEKHGICKKDIILKQFKSPGEYENYALKMLPEFLQRKEEEKEIAELLIEEE